ncbi:GntR family transcriptional regulator [Pseudoclavibacter sp. JSM 162008]|uniref:GntR family transcriptional regulator n=1 Tax=Pseudoclavibacter sp. JSM 162008 TaxID=3229855 RepID=UPI0035248FDF
MTQIKTETSPVIEQIRSGIVTGRFEPGELLAEIRLAEEFQVSRTPIREALKQLQIEGLVEIRPRVGSFVRKPTRREVVELFQMKEALEGLAAGLLAQRGEVPELRRLEQNIADEREAVRRGDAGAYAALVHDFHQTLVDGADNQKLTEHYELLMNQLAYHRLVQQTLEVPGRLASSLNEHAVILEAIRTRDPLTAELSARRHVAAARQTVAIAAFTDLEQHSS